MPCGYQVLSWFYLGSIFSIYLFLATRIYPHIQGLYRDNVHRYKGISLPRLGVAPGAEGEGTEMKSVILM